MLYLFTGTPGSGKSLHAARIIRDTLGIARKPVIANFPINEKTRGYERFRYIPNHQMRPDLLYEHAMEYWGGRHVREEEITLIIDEAQLIFNSRDWSQGDRMAWIEFLSQHRHYGYRVIFMTQFDRMIDRQIRSLCEYEVQHRKLGNYGIKGKIAALLCGGELFIAVKLFYGLKDIVGKEFFRPSKKLFRLYDSYSTFRRVGGAEGAGVSGDPAPMADDTPQAGMAVAEPEGFISRMISLLRPPAESEESGFDSSLSAGESL